MRQTNSDLQTMYAEFNRKYFGNKLPKDMAVRFSNEHPGALGYTAFRFGRPLYIQITKDFRWSNCLTAMTLLHEMVHVKLPFKFYHGPKFHKEMLRLAKIGAMRPWW